MATQVKPAAEHRSLDDLRPHPLQALYFRDLNDSELAGLANDIQVSGLKQRIEILPDDTILHGHQRRRALKKIGQVECEVLVRYDLAAAKPAVIEREFLSENLNRRQLGPMARARVAARLVTLEQEKKHRVDGDESHLRERVGKMLGASGRTVSRYLALLKTPIDVQNAVDQDVLPMSVALRFAGLAPEKQLEIVERVKKEPLRDVLKDYARPAKSKAKTKTTKARPAQTVDDFGTFIKSLQAHCRAFRPHLADLSSATIEKHEGPLADVRAMLRGIHEQLQQSRDAAVR
jgi:ParB-like chromosome segregation protein Spo0J